MLKIGNDSIATPKVMTVDIMDLDDQTTRNANGDLIRDRIAVKRKLNCEWGPLTNSDISALLSKVTATLFSVTYPDPLTGSNETKTFYVGDRHSPVYTIRNNIPLWEGLSMNFIER